MDLNKWRASRRYPITLPSGLAVVVRRVSPQDLVVSGQIPKPLLGMIGELVSENKDVRIDTSDLASLAKYIDQLPQLSELTNLIVKAALLEPLCADVADETHVAVSEFDPEDRETIFNFVTQEAKQIAPFSEQSLRDRDPGCAGTEIPPAPVVVSGDHGSMVGVSG